MVSTEYLVKKYLDALPADYYRLLIRHFLEEENPASFPAKFDFFTAEEIIRNVSYFKWRNTQGFNIYCRPEGIEYPLIDDLSRDVLQAIKQLKPSVLMETSPNNFQTFLRLEPKPKTCDEAKVICVELARRFNGDFRAAKPTQVGRLPGFTNRKPEHRGKDGLYPYVKLHGAKYRVSTFSPPGGACLADSLCMEIPKIKKKSSPSSWKSYDRSREDFRIACDMVRKGCSDEEIFYVLINREKGRERGKSYVNFTIKNARRAVMKYY